MSTRILRRPDVELVDLHGVVTTSPQMFEFFDLLKRVARTDATVLIRGETGTGKELVARMIHLMGPRSHGSFRAVNCATLTPELLASELFGHVRGAFTGAVKDRRGLFELADSGSLFLDEIAEIPLDIQARLLRVLQERSFVPLGASEPVHVDVRLISATHRAIREEVRQGRFREDLMYRVRVVPLFLPRLAERDGDVEALTWHFIEHFNQEGFRSIDGIEQRAMDALLDYGWPGNIRELRNVIEYAFVMGEGPVLMVSDLTPELRGEPPPGVLDDPETASEQERRRLLHALEISGGRRAEAARRLNLSRSTLWRKLREYGISR